MSCLRIVIISYGRPHRVESAETFPCARILVPKSQEKQYQKRFKGRVVAIDDGQDGNYDKKFNAALELFDEDMVIVDDDVSKICDVTTGRAMSPVEVFDLLKSGHRMAKDVGGGMWGFSTSCDPGRYMGFRPFSFVKPIYCVVGTMRDKIRHDLKIVPPEFGTYVDYWLQKINHYRKVFRFNKYYPVAKVGSTDGGIGIKENKRKYDALQRKWGSGIVEIKPNGKLGITCPIKGI